MICFLPVVLHQIKLHSTVKNQRNKNSIFSLTTWWATAKSRKKKVDVLLKERKKGSTDDMLFFQSLLQFMEIQIPLLRKSGVRSKIETYISQSSVPVYEIQRNATFSRAFLFTKRLLQNYISDKAGVKFTCNN